MKIYNYHYESRVFLNEEEADESPLEPGVYHIPANATIIPPLEEKFGYNVVWDFDKWIYVEKQNQTGEEIPNIKQVEYQAKALLASCDWILLPDVEVANMEEWLQYRKSLRSIASNPKEDDVIPERPQVIWK